MIKKRGRVSFVIQDDLYSFHECFGGPKMLFVSRSCFLDRLDWIIRMKFFFLTLNTNKMSILTTDSPPIILGPHPCHNK